jgi:hypothetical protein
MSRINGDVSNPWRMYLPPMDLPIQRFTLTPMDDAMTVQADHDYVYGSA